MNAFIDTVVGRPRTTLLLLFMVLLTGIASLRSIPVESDPSIAVPFFRIQVFNEGISAEDGERLLVLPLENELRSVEGVEELQSYSGENVSTVVNTQIGSPWSVSVGSLKAVAKMILIYGSSPGRGV